MSGNRFDHYGVPGEAAATPQRDWSDVPGEAWRNVPRSGADLMENLAYPFIHPIDTLRNLGDLAAGTASALTLDEIIGKVKASDPTAQTPQRMDELKRAVAAFREWNLPRSPERAAVDRVHAAIEAEIAGKAPNYAKAMADHWKAADQLNGVNGSLRVQNDDAGIRKLQAMSRTNVATSDGRRASLMDILARHEPALPYAPTGQAMKGSESSGFPARLLGFAHPALPFLAVPRLVGEGAYGGGSMMRRAGEMSVTPARTSAVLSGAYQTGRAAGSAAPAAPGARIFGGNSSADPESLQLSIARALGTPNERLAAGRR